MCGKAFADKSNLRAHVQTHSNIKPYTCSRCGKAFALKSYLYKHEESSSCMKLHRALGREVSQNSPSASNHSINNSSVQLSYQTSPSFTTRQNSNEGNQHDNSSEFQASVLGSEISHNTQSLGESPDHVSSPATFHQMSPMALHNQTPVSSAYSEVVPNQGSPSAIRMGPAARAIHTVTILRPVTHFNTAKVH